MRNIILSHGWEEIGTNLFKKGIFFLHLFTEYNTIAIKNKQKKFDKGNFYYNLLEDELDCMLDGRLN